MKVAFEEITFQSGSLAIIDQANAIIAEYRSQGYNLTLRQLYYQFVARDLIPNSLKSYKRLGNIVANGRLAGLIDWGAIEDRTRNLASNSHWDSPGDIIYSAAYGFRIDKWARQPNRLEVWVEKEALSGVVQPVCSRLDVAFMACRGYVSLSELFDAGQRLARYINSGQEVYILHLGDHDPSGIDMTRNLMERLSQMAENFVEVDRLALNFDQIEIYHPPPNPAKETDSRFGGYVEQYGPDSWELDALDPRTLSGIIESRVMELRDPDLWDKALAEEKEMRKQLDLASKNWGDVADYITQNFE